MRGFDGDSSSAADASNRALSWRSSSSIDGAESGAESFGTRRIVCVVCCCARMDLYDIFPSAGAE